MATAPMDRFIIESEIEHFLERLRSSLLDALEAREAAIRLAEARDALDRHDEYRFRHARIATMLPFGY